MRAAIAVPGVPRDADGPVFAEPWQARAFALALALHEAGLFSWNEWAAALAEGQDEVQLRWARLRKAHRGSLQ